MNMKSQERFSSHALLLALIPRDEIQTAILDAPCQPDIRGESLYSEVVPESLIHKYSSFTLNKSRVGDD